MYENIFEAYKAFVISFLLVKAPKASIFFSKLFKAFLKASIFFWKLWQKGQYQKKFFSVNNKICKNCIEFSYHPNFDQSSSSAPKKINAKYEFNWIAALEY